MNDTGSRCRVPGYNFCQFAPACMTLDIFFFPSGYLCLNTRGNTSVRGFFSYDMHMTWAAQAMDPQYWTQLPFLSVQESRWA